MKKKEGFPGQISFVVPEKVITLVKFNPLIADLYITDIGYYPKAQFHFRKRPAGSKQFILIYCVEGRGEIRLGERLLELPADHFIIIPAGKPHAYSSDENNPWSIYWIHFTGSKASFFTRFCNQCVPVERGAPARFSERIDLFSEIFGSLDGGYNIEALEYINLCLGRLLASFSHLSQYRLTRDAGTRDPVNQIISFMLENIKVKLRLKDLASEIGYSASYFSRIFLNRTGHSPIDYFIQLKIQRACSLLDNSKWQISDVSRELGFDDQFYFSRTFRKVMGMSPSRYRKRTS
ncbi:MAG TPA: AraC family transcriptional regulator [Bacteroidales bacterium]|nr:AraC family transcriptional regulator [Bacteroidales bacterium]